MKWKHDSDSKDTTMTGPTAKSVVSEPTGLKESLLAREDDHSLADRNQDPFAGEMEEIQDEVSHMVVEANLDGPQAQAQAQATTSQDSTPACSTSTSMTSLASTPSPSPAPLIPSSKEPVDSSIKSKAPLTASTPKEPIGSRPSVDRTQTSGNPYNRSEPWSYSTSSAYSYSAPTLSMSSLIHSKESVYAAVPVSSELYIIPKSSRGFHWNGDLFLKPHQRRSLGVDHMFSTSSSNYNSNYSSGAGPSSGQHPNQHHHNQDSSVMVHEIRLDEHEIDGILPSWP